MALLLLVTCLWARLGIGLTGGCGVGPVYIWPLGRETGTLELVTNTNAGSMGVTQFEPGPLGYTAMTFPGGSATLQIRRPPTPLTFYNLQFYVNVQTDGEILHYFHQGSTAAYISLLVSGGAIEVRMDDGTTYESHVLQTALIYNTWWMIDFVRDYDSERFSVHYKGNEFRIDEPLSAFRTWPLEGNITIGGGFGGAFGCLQVLPCDEPRNATFFDIDCKSWMSATPTTTSPPTPTSAATTPVVSTSSTVAFTTVTSTTATTPSTSTTLTTTTVPPSTTSTAKTATTTAVSNTPSLASTTPTSPAQMSDTLSSSMTLSTTAGPPIAPAATEPLLTTVSKTSIDTSTNKSTTTVSLTSIDTSTNPSTTTVSLTSRYISTNPSGTTVSTTTVSLTSSDTSTNPSITIVSPTSSDTSTNPSTTIVSPTSIDTSTNPSTTTVSLTSSDTSTNPSTTTVSTTTVSLTSSGTSTNPSITIVSPTSSDTSTNPSSIIVSPTSIDTSTNPSTTTVSLTSSNTSTNPSTTTVSSTSRDTLTNPSTTIVNPTSPTTPAGLGPLMPAQPPVRAACHRAVLVQADAVLTDPADVLHVMVVTSVRACLSRCSNLGACGTFVYTSAGMCWLGKPGGTGAASTGAMLYAMVW